MTGPDDTTPPSAADDTGPQDAMALTSPCLLPGSDGPASRMAFVQALLDPLDPVTGEDVGPLVSVADARTLLAIDDCLDDDEPERTWPIIGSAT